MASEQSKRNSLPQTSSESKPAVDLGVIYETLLEVKSVLDSHIAEEQIYRPQIVELIKLLERSKGAVVFIKILSVIAVAGWTLVYWVRDHLRL